MSHPTSTPRHPLLACADTIEKALAAARDGDPLYLDRRRRPSAAPLTRLITRLEARRLRAVAAAGDVAADYGCRTVADWIAPRTALDRRVAYAQRSSPTPWTRPGTRSPLP